MNYSRLIPAFTICCICLFLIMPWSGKAETHLSNGDLSKIKGGEEASIEDWPWVAAIVHHGRNPYRGQFCGGAMISPQWVITAAHCLADMAGMLRYEPGDVDLIIGRSNLLEDHGERITAARLVIHPEYDGFINESDVALIYLEKTPEISTTWAYIPVIQADDPNALTKPGRLAWIAGWGALGPTGPFPQDLQQASVPLVSQEKLIQAYPPDEYVITDNMMGAGPGDGSVDTCQGDSGGPLMVMNHYDRFELAGVTSWGQQCGMPDVYGVYVRLSNYCDWIVEVTGVDDCAHVSRNRSSGGGCTVAGTDVGGAEWFIILAVLAFMIKRAFPGSRLRPDS